MTAAENDFVIDQGADFAVQLYWVDYNDQPRWVTAPMRMEIRTKTGQLAAELFYNETPLAGDPPSKILFNSESGLIQLLLSGDDTDKMLPGIYYYDLFVTYSDQLPPSPSNRLYRLLYGKVEVRGKVTRNV